MHTAPARSEPITHTHRSDQQSGTHTATVTSVQPVGSVGTLQRGVPLSCKMHRRPNAPIFVAASTFQTEAGVCELLEGKLILDEGHARVGAAPWRKPSVCTGRSDSVRFHWKDNKNVTDNTWAESTGTLGHTNRCYNKPCNTKTFVISKSTCESNKD